MATDYSIYEQELIDLKTKLIRDLHMQNIRRLRGKQNFLAANIVQSKQIKVLEKQVAELEPQVSATFSPRHVLKDHEIKGYLVYLLKMKDFFEMENAAIKERIKQRDSQINMEFRKLCGITNEKAKLIKNKPVKSSEFNRLENLCNSIEQTNKRISTIKQENKEIMDNIRNMRKFQKQFKTFEREFHQKIDCLKRKKYDLLEKAVSLYEEKDEFMTREKIYQERLFRDLRKTEIAQNTLNLCIQKREKNEAFQKLQNSIRVDSRVDETSDMIGKGVTGLESELQKMKDLEKAISEASDEDTAEEMEENFRITDDKIEIMFSYYDELLKDIGQLQEEISNEKKEIHELTQNMSSHDRKLRNNIKLNQEEATKKLEEANKESEFTEEAKNELNSSLDIVKSLYITCCPEDAIDAEENSIDETNVLDYLQKIEKQLLDYLICLEYKKMKEESEKEKPLLIEVAKDDAIEDQVQKVEPTDIIKPRPFVSGTDLHSLMDLETEERFLEFQTLKEMSVAAIEEILSGKSADESDETA